MAFRTVLFVGFVLHTIIECSNPARADDVARLVNPTPQGTSTFTFSVHKIALDGDTCAIVVPFSNLYPTQEEGFNVQVFRRYETRWMLEAVLNPPIGDEPTGFGYDIALAGDTLAVAAPFTGVRIFNRVDDAWSLQTTLFESLPDQVFPRSLAFGGNDLFVGTDNSVVHRFTRSGGDWTELQQISGPEGETLFNLGRFIAADSENLVLSANRPESGGALLVYALVDDTWVFRQMILPEAKLGLFVGVLELKHGIIAANEVLNQTGTPITHVYRLNETENEWQREATLMPSVVVSNTIHYYNVAVKSDMVIVGGRIHEGGNFLTQYRFDGSGWYQGMEAVCPQQCAGDNVPNFTDSIAIDNGRIALGAVPHSSNDIEGVGATSFSAMIGGVGLGADPDCNGNLIQDGIELQLRIADDCNGNGVLDECEPWADTDCNNNGICDADEITSENPIVLADCNRNGILDVCESQADIDSDGTIEVCDNCPYVPNPDQFDCNDDGIGDVCAILAGISEDCNGDGVPDECGQDYRNEEWVGPASSGTLWHFNQSDGDMTSLQHFVVQAGAEYVNSVSVYWSLSVATPAKILIYQDPTNDGNPVDAVLVSESDIISPDDAWPWMVIPRTLVTYLIEPAFVGDAGDHFFVGVFARGYKWPAMPWPNSSENNDAWFVVDELFANRFHDLSQSAVSQPFQNDQVTSWLIRATSSRPSLCACIADIANSSGPGGTDGVVNVADLFALLSQWGECRIPCPPTCLEDFNGDCNVNVTDLFLLLSAWGNCQ